MGLEVIPDDDYDKTKNVKHYIYVRPYEGEDILILLSKDEYDRLDPMIEDIQQQNYERYECEFTRTTIKDMAKNPTEYGPEMRARIMMSSCPDCGEGLAGSVYRPRCSDCDCDSDAAYREHPLDHE